MKLSRWSLVVLPLSLAAACAADPDVDPGPTVASSTESIRGQQLAQLDVDDALQVRFYELEPGVVAVRESGDLDAVTPGQPLPSALAGVDPAKATIVDVYRAIAPDAPVPATVLAADARALVSAELAAARPAPATSPPVQGEPYVPTGRTPRSPDWNGNGYDWQWFMDNFCVEGGFRFCPTNVTWAYSGLEQTSWFKTCTFAADWDAGVQFKGQWWKYYDGVWPWYDGFWHAFVDWDYVVQPRHWECWWYSGSGYRESWATGLDPAPRVHFSALRNHN
jgi:hypothetical protein